MKFLAVYGYHREEKAFGQRVCEEYIKRYQPTKDVFRALKIKNSIPANSIVRWIDYKDFGIKRHPDLEIKDLINQYKPNIFIDIHHSKGFQLEEKDFTKPIDVSLNNPSPKFGFRNFLDNQCSDIARIFNRTVRDEYAIREANRNNTHLLTIEILMEGHEWVFPHNKTNNQTLKKAVSLLSRIPEYIRQIYSNPSD
jgi:hypothetical protein